MPLPTIPTEKPVWNGKSKDVIWGVLFVIHVIAIIGVAFALGIPAVKDDSKAPEDDPNRSECTCVSGWFDILARASTSLQTLPTLHPPTE